MQHQFKNAGLLALCLVFIGATFLLPPIPQDTLYHLFADQRAIFHIPNGWNVASNLPFMLVGLAGLGYLWRYRAAHIAGCINTLQPLYVIFFIGVFITGIGSAYYHWAPSNDTLVWDRLPMTLSFMAFFSILVGEQISVRLARLIILPLLLAGIASVGWWHYSEQVGAGDLRPYILVQFLPILLTPILLLGYRSPFSSNKAIWLLIALYLGSKIAEHFDPAIYISGFSGHSLKHLLAAAASFCILLALKNRSLCDNKPLQ